jgi:glucose uptake protein
MFVVESYPLAVALCVVTMLCWGSWGNTMKLASKEWRFQLFYWDYAIGVLLLTLGLALTLGSTGAVGRSFVADLQQAASNMLLTAFIGGVIFNLSNILLVAAIDIAGMAVAFPVGVGLALAIGVITNYVAAPVGNAALLFTGVAGVVAAIILCASAYGKLPRKEDQKTVGKGLALSVAAGVLMGFFYRFVAESMFDIQFTGGRMVVVNAEPGKLSPYTALVVFSVGIFVSNFLWNSIMMARPFVGGPVPFGAYFSKGNLRLHSIGILGGIIWGIGMSLSIIASSAAGFAISYGLGQGATAVAALWGVFIWKEFKHAPAGTNSLLAAMFASFIVGLALIVTARLV